MLGRLWISVLYMWRDAVVLQRCQRLRARGYRVRKHGQLLLISGGQNRTGPRSQQRSTPPGSPGERRPPQLPVSIRSLSGLRLAGQQRAGKER